MSDKKVDKYEKFTVDDGLNLLKQERVIRDNTDGFRKVGAALEIIRDERLYRRDFKTFEDYCQKKWGYGRRYANQVVAGAAAVKSLPPDLGVLVPKSSAAVALSKVPVKDRAAVVNEVSKGGAPVTAKSITEQSKAKFVPLPRVTDELGWVIPEKIMHLWNRRPEVKKLMEAISEVKCHVDAALEENDPLYRELQNSIVADLKQVYHNLRYAMPYAVCTCNGQLIEKCTLCKGRGFLSIERYKTVPIEIRNMREKAIKQGGRR